MWPDDRLTRLLGIEHPIILAPMAGTTTPELAAAISNAGGLGSHGCAALPPDVLAADMAALRSRTNAPVNLNFFCHVTEKTSPERHTALRAELAGDYADAGVTPVSDLPDEPSFTPFGAGHLEVLLAHPPAVVSFHFGLPGEADMAGLKKAGCTILCTATTVAEAQWLETRGVDAIIAQGWEAGGHRGVFIDVARDAQIGLFALLPQIADAVSVPVIAAGGIADGRGIAAALTLGASGVQMGTAFVTCNEAARHEVHVASVRAGRDDSTLVTTAGSGRPARGHRTEWLTRMAGVTAAPFPEMYHYFSLLQLADPKRFQFSLYGQAARMAPTGSARDRFDMLVRDAQAALGRRT